MGRPTVCKNEAAVKKQVRLILDLIGCFYFLPPANAFGRSGISDFVGLSNGRFFAIETKFGKNRPTPMQERFLTEVNIHGGLALVVSETNLGDVWKVREL